MAQQTEGTDEDLRDRIREVATRMLDELDQTPADALSLSERASVLEHIVEALQWADGSPDGDHGDGCHRSRR